MGNCGSFDSTQEEKEEVTAKVVAHDGKLQEFSYPVKVSYLLQLYPACFICDSDEMGLDDVVTAVHEDEVLRPGQLYFALPLTRLKRTLPAEELAALAVKASYALTRSGGEKCGFRQRKQIVFFSGEGNAKPSPRRVVPESGIVGAAVDRSRRGRRRSGGGCGGRKFAAVLSSIPE